MKYPLVLCTVIQRADAEWKQIHILEHEHTKDVAQKNHCAPNSMSVLARDEGMYT